MFLLFSILLVFSSQSIAHANSNYYDMQTKLNFAIIANFYGTEDFVNEADELKTKRDTLLPYAERLKIFQKPEAFARDKDTPADNIDISKDVVLNKWQQFKSEESGINSADKQALLDLNLEAHDVWQAIVDCHIGDAEAARRAYFAGNYNCAEKREIAHQRKSLQSRILQFLETSIITSPTAIRSNSSGLSAIMRGDLQSMFPVFHPLFTQVILESLAKHTQMEAHSNNHFNKKWCAISESVPLERITPTALTTKMLSCNKYNAKLSEQDRQEARRFLNTFLILEATPEEKCQAWGLWPAATQGLLAHISRSATAKFFYNTFEVDPIRVILFKNLRSCGTSHLRKPKQGEVQYGSVEFGDTALNEFKRMSF